MPSILKTSLKTSLPAFFCYFPLGIVYGVLCSQNGYHWFYAPLFSLFVLAGAMQFLALSLVAAGAPLLTIALTLIPIGIRNIFYGLTMLKRYKHINFFLKLYLAHGLVDATYSLLNAGPTFSEKQETRYITSLTILVHLYWVIGSLLGSFVVYFVTLPKGLEFSMTAFFAAAAVEQFLKQKELKPIFIALSAILISVFFAPHHFFLAAVMTSILISLAVPRKKRIAT